VSAAGAGERAVVVGGSVAGLLAARALSDRFAEVTLVERDRYPGDPEFRKGVPQARHIHLLLIPGAAVVERFFPGFAAEIVAAGAQEIDWSADIRWYQGAHMKRRFPTDLIVRNCTRPMLEHHIRRRLSSVPNVRIVEGCDAHDLVADAARRRVTGVRIRERGTGVERELTADLVVDASGRDSPAPRWLEALGYDAPRETIIDSFLGYATCLFAPPPGLARDWKIMTSQARAPGTRMGTVYTTEGGRWQATLVGIARDYPPTDFAGYLEFARSLQQPHIHEHLRQAEPLTPVYGYRGTQNRLRHFDALARRPEGFVATGDAVCAFNPIYGQGMTTAAQGAALLAECVSGGAPLEGLAARFHRRLRAVIDPPWLIATNEDFRYPTTTGERPGRAVRLIQKYFDAAARAGHIDAEVHRAFLRVIQLVAPPTSLLRPSLAIRTFLANLRWRESPPPDPAHAPWLARGAAAGAAVKAPAG
jgi:flavin-dependent dehydrogenase